MACGKRSKKHRVGVTSSLPGPRQQVVEEVSVWSYWLACGDGRIRCGCWYPLPPTTLSVHQEVDRMETVWRAQEGSHDSSGKALSLDLLCDRDRNIWIQHQGPEPWC